jgi:hypothetical protein
MSRGRVNMVTDDEQTEFFEIIFAPLRTINISKINIKKATDLANEFFEGKKLKQYNLEFKDWDTTSLNETELASWKWLIGMRKAYPRLRTSGIEVHKFVWHKKLNEAGWGPKVVIKEGKERSREFQYITKPMEKRRELEIRKVGSEFNLFQPPQQDYDHVVWNHEIDGTTTFKVLAEKGKTLGEVFDDYIKKEKFPELKNLFDKIIQLYLQREIETLPSIGFVDAQKPSWKGKKTSKNTWLKDLENIEKGTPFLIPLRWVETEDKECISLLHGDEWGANFIAPINPDAGSVRPIDFEDAHIQGVEVDLDQENNIISYIKPIKNTHRTAGGDLAYRASSFWNSWKHGDPPPLHAYSSMSALGRLFAALVQKRTMTPFLEDDDTWIETVTALFFHCLRTEVEKRLTSNEGDNLLKELKLNRKFTQHGLMARAVLATYNWSNYWKHKVRDTDEDDQYYIGKWKKSSLEEFQFQLRVQGEWEMMTLDSMGRLSTYANDYVRVLQNEHDSEEWNEREMKDLENCMRYIETRAHGTEDSVPPYQELTVLRILNWEAIESTNLIYKKVDNKYDRLSNKICIICAHLLAHQMNHSPDEITEDHRKFLKDCKECTEIYGFPDETRNDITLLADGHGVIFSTAQPSFNFQRRGENWNLKLAYEIKKPIDNAIYALKRHPVPRQRGGDFLKSFQEHIRLLVGFRSRWELSSKSSQDLIDSTILGDTQKVSEWLMYYYCKLPHRDFSEIIMLTELLKTMDTQDRTYKDIPYSISIMQNSLVCLKNLEINSPSEEFSEYTKFLRTGIKRTIGWDPKFEKDEYLKHNIMKFCVKKFNEIPVLRKWAIEFRNHLNQETLNPHKEQEWYNEWMAME